tara:strand:+ start:262 stop:495 length:234 start_codon:yes stop_codon:yes gene_type:complete
MAIMLWRDLSRADDGVAPKVKAMEHIIAGAMVRIAEREAEFYSAEDDTEYDRKVIKQMKKLVNRMARDIGADDQYIL